MSLQIDFDIADSLVTNRSFQIDDTLVRSRDQGEFGASNLWFLPGGGGITLFPDQLTAGWSGAGGKWATADFITPGPQWETLPYRHSGDWFQQSKGLAATAGVAVPLVSAERLPENTGLFVEFFAYGVPGTRTTDLLKVDFGQFFTLHIHSDGRADLTDSRRYGQQGQSPYVTQGQSLSSGSAAGAKGDLSGKFVSILILPYRRGRLLFVTNQGGSFEVIVGDYPAWGNSYGARMSPGENVYHVTTPASQVMLTPSPLVRALLTVNPVTYPATGLLTSPALPLPYAVGVGPESVRGESEMQDGSGLNLSLLNADGSSFSPTTTSPAPAVVYQVSLSSPSPRVAPVLFGLVMTWGRVLSTRTYGTSTLTRVLSAKLTMARDRQQKCFDFTLDNPRDTYTSVKDLWNRRVRCSIVPGGADAQPIVLFDGYSNAPAFTDGAASKITVSCTGLRKRLRSHMLSDSIKFDGQAHTDVVARLLNDAGVDPATVFIYNDGGLTLGSADQGDDALWRPANGQSTDEFIQHLADTFSGWVFDDIGGIFYYAPKEYFTAAALTGNGYVPTIQMQTPIYGGVASTRPVNPSDLVALAGSVKQCSEEPRANDIYVIGQADDGSLFNVHYEDWDSINTRTAANYVGERRTLVYASGSITTPDAASITLGALVNVYTQALRTVEFALPDYPASILPLEGPVNLIGFGLALITNISADLTVDRNRHTEYTCELL